MSYPKEIAPTTIFGLFPGQIRYEKVGPPREESWVPGEKLNLIINEKPYDGWGITHQQRRAKFMILLQKPWCFHFLFVFKFRGPDNVSGSEVVFYWRVGKWRWDPQGTNGKHWIGPDTWYMGLHYD